MEIKAMKKRVWVSVVFILIIGMALGGCGTSGDSSTQIDTAPAISDAAAADSGTMADFYGEQDGEAETWAKAPNDMGAMEESVTEPTLDEVIEEVFNYVESEGMVIVGQTVDINEMIKLLYIAEEYDAFEIFQYLCDSGQIVSAPIAPEGIIVLNYNGPRYVWNGKGNSVTVNLDCINPDTGVVQNLRTFYSEDAGKCSPAFNGLAVNAIQARMHFNSDLTQMTATATLEDGSVHVGWIEENGRFTDVSSMVTADAGDFGALMNHSNPCFGSDGYFYFRDLTNSNVQIKRVPINNLTVSAVEILIDNDRYSATYLSPLPDGTIDDYPDKWYYYDENMTYPARGKNFGDWISVSECVGIENNVIYKYSLSETTQNHITWDDNKTALIPDINGRENWNLVVSPDASRVAFLSKLTVGTDTLPYLYIVPVSGGDPIKVSTNYSFDDSFNFENYSRGFYSSCLITWE